MVLSVLRGYEGLGGRAERQMTACEGKWEAILGPGHDLRKEWRFLVNSRGEERFVRLMCLVLWYSWRNRSRVADVV
jgi:hypothetical protein